MERYLRLGLQLGRHVDGIVDAYFGPPELAAAVDAEPPVEPKALVAAADALFDELEDGWLRDQVVGLRTYAGALAGEPGSYADEVEGCYGVRPVHTDEAVFVAAHERLEELLPGDGSLAERFERWEGDARARANAAVACLRGGLPHSHRPCCSRGKVAQSLPPPFATPASSSTSRTASPSTRLSRRAGGRRSTPR